ncbi:MAG: hypothetical protein M3Z98_06250 [Candidatus Dormibacteraeota bacterium]|nr:hypothetical protein [Candidatus Dormibacteraeota bacterium]
MNLIDLSRRLSLRAVRRLANRYRRQLVGGVSLTGAVAFSIMLAVPAIAHDGESGTPLAACSATLPLTTPCSATVTPTPAAGVTDYAVTLPGVGTLNITIDPVTNLITLAKVTGVDPAFTASAVTINEDGNKASVTLTSADGTQVYTIKASVKPPATAGGAPTITAKVKTPEKEEADDESEASDADDAPGAAKPVSAPRGGGGGEHKGGGGGDH